jgi:hypothetical protein
VVGEASAACRKAKTALTKRSESDHVPGGETRFCELRQSKLVQSSAAPIWKVTALRKCRLAIVRLCDHWVNRSLCDSRDAELNAVCL